jgi:diacylglycerol kinase family enzyme
VSTQSAPVGTPTSARNRWIARLAFALAGSAVVVLLAFAGIRGSFRLFAVGLAGAILALMGVWWFFTRRGLLRWLALGLAVAGPAAIIILYVRAGLLWVVLLSAGLWFASIAAGRAALMRDASGTPLGETVHEVPPPQRPFLIMNPRSGGGKVQRFGLQQKAQELGAEVAMLDGPGHVDVAAIAEEAVASGADLLGVAGGDGTQALVAGIAARHGLPFLVISAGTRNHFALDLGLDRENPATCLDALTDGVELRVDLGVIGDRTFVNNASFGAYAAVVQSPAYREDKTGTTLQLLPDLLVGHAGPHLVLRSGDTTVEGAQAVLVSNNTYETNDVAGLGRRTRLDGGALGVLAIRVTNAVDAARLVRGMHARGLTSFTAAHVIVDAETAAIPVGIDGESVMMPTPVHCTVRPQELRVRVPRDRSRVYVPKLVMDWHRLRTLALHPA